MYDARAITNYFLDRAEQTGTAVTIMTLLKVLYFPHAWYLAKYKNPWSLNRLKLGGMVP